MIRCVCGSESGGHARFCWSCGRPVGDPGDEGIVGLGDGESSVSVVRSGGWDRRYLLPLVGAIAAVALAMIWGAGQGEPADQSENPAQDSASVEPTTTTRSIETASSDTIGPARGQSTSIDVEDLGASFDVPVGYDLLIATVGRPARLDLDAGTVTYAEGSRVFPQFAWGPWLIVGAGFNVDVARLPLDDLGADPEPFVEVEDTAHGYIVSPIARAIETGEIWIAVTTGLNTSEPTETLQLFDIETGALLDERAADSEGWRLAGGDREGLFTAPSGGIYQAEGDTYRRVTDGRILTYDDQRALVQICDDALVCALRWMDTETWGPLDLVVPEDQDALFFIIPNTDWLFSPIFDNGAGPTSGDLLNIATGEVITVDLPESTFIGPSLPTPAVSPDGRWLATRGDDTQHLELRDLTSGDTLQIQLEERIAGPMFFIDDRPQD